MINRLVNSKVDKQVSIEGEVKEIKHYSSWKDVIFTTSMFREIVKRLQAFGLINLTIDTHKITDNSHLQSFVQFDEARLAFEFDQIFQCEKQIIETLYKSD